MVNSNKSWLCLNFVTVIICTVYGESLTVPPCTKMYKISEKNHIFKGYINIESPSGLTYLDLSVKLLISLPIFDEKLKISNSENEVKSILKNGGNVNYFIHFRYKNSTSSIESIYLNGNMICDSASKKFHRKKRKHSHVYLNNSLRPSGDGFSENFKASKDHPKTVEPQEILKADRREAITNTSTFDRRIRKRSVPDDCGITTITNSLIIGGSSASLGEWPWLASIHIKYDFDLDFKCAATLISESHVITVAICVSKNGKPYPSDPKDLLVKTGVHDIDDWLDEEVIKKEAKNIYIHPNFDKSKYMNNVGIVSFDSVRLSARIQPICLWSGDMDLEEISGKTGMVVGWGEDEDNDVIKIAQKISMPVASIIDCYSTKVKPLLSPNTFCAGSRDGTGPCNNDGGDGFYMFVDGRWRIRGIVSLTMTRKTVDKVKCDLNEYLIFADIARHRSWIEKVLNE